MKIKLAIKNYELRITNYKLNCSCPIYWADNSTKLIYQPGLFKIIFLFFVFTVASCFGHICSVPFYMGRMGGDEILGLGYENVFAQEPPKVEWEKTFGGSKNDVAYSIQQTSDGGYISAGKTASFGAGLYDVYILKLDSNGNKTWEKTFGGSNDDEAHSIQQSSDGGYIVAGYTKSFGAGKGDFYVLKLNADGNKIWEKTFGGSNDDYATSIQQSSDGGYISAGGTDSFGVGSYDFYVLKLSANGNKIWEKTFGGNGGDDASSIQQTSDGGYIVAGYTYYFGAEGSANFYVIKLSAEGNKIWEKTFDGENWDRASSIQQTSDGGYIVAGGTTSFGAGNWDFYVLKLSPDGPPKPTLPPNLITSIKFTDEDGNNFLDAEETGKIIVNVANKGEGDAYQVSVVLKPEISNLQLPITNLKYEEKISVGEIATNTEKKIEIPISANENISNGKISFKIKTFEANGFDADTVLLSFATQKLKEPNLKIASVGIEEVSTVIKNAKIDLGESIDVKAIVQNSGEGTAKNVSAQIEVPDSNIFLTSEKNFNLGNIASGDYKEISFNFLINKKYSGSSILPIYLNLNEQRAKFSKKENLNLVLGEQTKTIAEVTIKGTEEKTTIKQVPNLTSDVDNIQQVANFYRDNVYVVSIGISNYKEAEKIPYASNDAIMFAEYMQKAGGIPKGRIYKLLDEEATGGVILGTLKDKLKNVRKDDTIIIFYAGHGAPDPAGGEEVYLVPYDGKADLPSTLIARSQISKILSDLKTQKIIFIMDSCFSGKGRSIIAKTGRPFYLSAEGSFFKNLNVLVLAATKGEQQSFDYEKGKHGLFTYSLLKGLQGSADKNNDGVVSLEEAFNFAKETTEKLALTEIGTDQNPMVLPSEEFLQKFGNLIMTKVAP